MAVGKVRVHYFNIFNPILLAAMLLYCSMDAALLDCQVLLVVVVAMWGLGGCKERKVLLL